jgi:hypothetical protein
MVVLGPKSITRPASVASPRAVDKEYADSPSRFAPVGTKMAVRADEMVPLRPAAAERAVKRVALYDAKPLPMRAATGPAPVVAAVPGAGGGLMSGTDALRARLAANRLGAKKPVA